MLIGYNIINMSNFIKNFLFLCDHALIENNQKLSVIGIFDSIQLRSIPGTILKSVLVGSYNVVKKINTAKLEIKLEDDSGKSILINLPTINVALPVSDKTMPQRLNFTIEIGNLKFEKAGTYKFIIYFNGDKVDEYKFNVTKV